MELLTDEQIEATKKEAERLSLTHKVHPRFEKEKYLLQAQALFTRQEIVEWGDETCPHWGGDNMHKRQCHLCWQALREGKAC